MTEVIDPCFNRKSIVCYGDDVNIFSKVFGVNKRKCRVQNKQLTVNSEITLNMHSGIFVGQCILPF